MSRPVLLFACVHNGGRSVAGKVLAEHHSGGAVEARSAGSEPGALNAAVVEVLRERGLSAAGEVPTLLTRDVVVEADVVITMGCGEACPFVPGKRIIDWELEDPQGKDLETVRRIVDEIDERVQALLAELTSS